MSKIYAQRGEKLDAQGAPLAGSASVAGDGDVLHVTTGAAERVIGGDMAALTAEVVDEVLPAMCETRETVFSKRVCWTRTMSVVRRWR